MTPLDTPATLVLLAIYLLAATLPHIATPTGGQ